MNLNDVRLLFNQTAAGQIGPSVAGQTMPKHYAYQVQQNNHPLPSTSSSTIKSPLPDIDGQNEQNDHILDRRQKKPLMEKKRRARMNKCFDKLKELLLKSELQQGFERSKLEKSDILEKTLEFVHFLMDQNSDLQRQLTYLEKDAFQRGFCQGVVQSGIPASVADELLKQQRISPKKASEFNGALPTNSSQKAAADFPNLHVQPRFSAKTSRVKTPQYQMQVQPTPAADNQPLVKLLQTALSNPQIMKNCGINNVASQIPFRQQNFPSSSSTQQPCLANLWSFPGNFFSPINPFLLPPSPHAFFQFPNASKEVQSVEPNGIEDNDGPQSSNKEEDDFVDVENVGETNKSEVAKEACETIPGFLPREDSGISSPPEESASTTTPNNFGNVEKLLGNVGPIKSRKSKDKFSRAAPY